MLRLYAPVERIARQKKRTVQLASRSYEVLAHTMSEITGNPPPFVRWGVRAEHARGDLSVPLASSLQPGPHVRVGDNLQ
jgi:hypothetical protein